MSVKILVGCTSEQAEVCELIEPLVNKRSWLEEFVNKDLKEFTNLLNDVCMVSKAFSVLLGDGIRLGDIDDPELKEKLLVAVLGGIKEESSEEKEAFADFMRRVFGVGMVLRKGSRDIINSSKEIIEYLRTRSIDDIIVAKQNGAIDDICGLIYKIRNLCDYLTNKLGTNSVACKEFTLKDISKDNAGELIKRVLPFQGDERLDGLTEMLKKLRKALAILSIGSNRFLTAAYVVRFMPIRALSVSIMKCTNIDEGNLCNIVRDIIDFLGLKIFDLAGNTLHTKLDCNNLKSSYIITAFETFGPSRPWDRSKSTLEFVMSSEIYDTIYCIKRLIPRAEEKIFGDSIVLRVYQEFILKNLRAVIEVIGNKYRELLSKVHLGEEIEISVPEDKFFKADDLEKILIMYPFVAIGLYDVSVGTGVVYMGSKYNSPCGYFMSIRFYPIDRELKLQAIIDYVKGALKEVGVIDQKSR